LDGKNTNHSLNDLIPNSRMLKGAASSTSESPFDTTMPSLLDHKISPGEDPQDFKENVIDIPAGILPIQSDNSTSLVSK
jgi:hypothetical protein